MSTVMRHGERPRWYAETRDLRGHRIRFPLTERATDRRQARARAMLQEFDQFIADVSVGLQRDPNAVSPAIRGAIYRALDRDGHELAGLRGKRLPLKDVIAEWQCTLASSRSNPRHVAQTIATVQRMADACGWTYLADLDGDHAVRQLETWQREDADPGHGRRFGPRTHNDHIRCLRQFARWCMARRRPYLQADPFRFLARVETHQAEARVQRRCFAADEMARLLAVAPEPHRTLYALLRETGARPSEARRLRWCDLDLQERAPTVTLRGKDRRYRTIPILEPLRIALTAHSERNPPGGTQDRLFNLRPARGEQSLFRDLLRAAGISRRDDQGRIVDRYSFRHTRLTELARTGAPISVVQAIAGHSSYAMTARHYIHVGADDTRAATVAAAAARPSAEADAG